MIDHHVAQAVFNTMLDGGRYCPGIRRVRDLPYGSSILMCTAIHYARVAGVITPADADEAIACISEYMVELAFGQDASEQDARMARGTTMLCAMAQRGVSNTPQDRIHLYRNWLERPRYKEAP